MGMYSYFEEEDIKVIDGIGFVKFLYEYTETENGKFYYKDLNDAKVKFLENGKFSLDFLNDTKLISYWYNQTCHLLNEVAKYIEGYAEFGFETEEEKVRLEFYDKKCKIILSKREWEVTGEHNPLDLLEEKSEIGLP